MGSTTSTLSDHEIFAEARRKFPHAGRIALESTVIAGASGARLRLLTTYHGAKWKAEAVASNRPELLLLLKSMTAKRGPDD